MAIATANVTRHYNIGLTDKQKDFIGLAIAVGSIYAPKIMAIRARKIEERKQEQ
jgi:predicted nuclease of predicted toxin-antitoxin system